MPGSGASSRAGSIAARDCGQIRPAREAPRCADTSNGPSSTSASGSAGSPVHRHAEVDARARRRVHAHATAPAARSARRTRASRRRPRRAAPPTPGRPSPGTSGAAAAAALPPTPARPRRSGAAPRSRAPRRAQPATRRAQLDALVDRRMRRHAPPRTAAGTPLTRSAFAASAWSRRRPPPPSVSTRVVERPHPLHRAERQPHRLAPLAPSSSARSASRANARSV